MPAEKGCVGTVFAIRVEVVVGPISFTLFVCGGPIISKVESVDIGGSGCGASTNILGSRTRGCGVR